MSKVFSELSVKQQQRLIDTSFNPRKNIQRQDNFFINEEIDSYIFDKTVDLENKTVDLEICQKNFSSILKYIKSRNYAIQKIFSRTIANLLQNFQSFYEIKKLLQHSDSTNANQTVTIFELIQNTLPILHRTANFLRLMNQLIRDKIKQPLNNEQDINSLLRFIEQDSEVFKYGLEFKTVIEFAKKSANQSKILEILRPSLSIRFNAWFWQNSAEKLVSVQLTGAQIVEAILTQPNLIEELLRKPSWLSQLVGWGEINYIEKLDNNDWKKLLSESTGKNHQAIKEALLKTNKFSEKQKDIILNTFSLPSPVIEQPKLTGHKEKIKSKIQVRIEGKKRIDKDGNEILPKSIKTTETLESDVDSKERKDNKFETSFSGSPYIKPELVKNKIKDPTETGTLVVVGSSFPTTPPSKKAVTDEKKSVDSPLLNFEDLKEDEKKKGISPVLNYGNLQNGVSPQLNYGDLQTTKETEKKIVGSPGLNFDDLKQGGETQPLDKNELQIRFEGLGDKDKEKIEPLQKPKSIIPKRKKIEFGFGIVKAKEPKTPFNVANIPTFSQ